MEQERGEPYTPALIVYGDRLYAISNNGIITCCQKGLAAEPVGHQLARLRSNR